MRMALVLVLAALVVAGKANAENAQRTPVRETCAMMLSLGARDASLNKMTRDFATVHDPGLLLLTAEQMDPSGKVAKMETKQLRSTITQQLIVLAEAALPAAKAGDSVARSKCGLYFGMARRVIGYDKSVSDRVRVAEEAGISCDEAKILPLMLMKAMTAKAVEQDKAEKPVEPKSKFTTSSLAIRNYALHEGAYTSDTEFYPKMMDLTISASSGDFSVSFAGAAIDAWQYATSWRGADVQVSIKGNEMILNVGSNSKEINAIGRAQVALERPSRLVISARPGEWGPYKCTLKEVRGRVVTSMEVKEGANP